MVLFLPSLILVPVCNLADLFKRGRHVDFQVHEDVELTFANALLYNPKESEVSVAAKQVQPQTGYDALGVLNFDCSRNTIHPTVRTR